MTKEDTYKTIEKKLLKIARMSLVEKTNLTDSKGNWLVVIDKTFIN